MFDVAPSWVIWLLLAGAVLTAVRKIWLYAIRPVVNAARRANTIFESYGPEGQHTELVQGVKAVRHDLVLLASDLRGHMDTERERDDRTGELFSLMQTHMDDDKEQFVKVHAKLLEIQQAQEPRV